MSGPNVLIPPLGTLTHVSVLSRAEENYDTRNRQAEDEPAPGLEI
jgi:hypothetical protein